MRKNEYRKYLKVGTFILSMSLMLNIGFTAMIIHMKRAQESLVQNKVDKAVKVSDNKENAIKMQVSKSYEEAIKKAFTEEELSYAMQRQWNYIITVNGQEIKGNQTKVRSGNIRIMVAETINNRNVFSEDLLSIGSIDEGNNNVTLPDLIEVYSVVPYELHREENEEGIKYYYTFENVPKETMIILTLSPILTDKLEYKDKLKDNQIALITQ